MNLINKIKNQLINGDFKLLINVCLTFILKGASLLIAFFSTPLYIKYFNNDAVLGFWYTILSILNFINIFDLGLGNGLRNHLTISYEKNEQDKTKKVISSAYFMVGIIAVILFIVGIVICYFVNGNKIFNISEEDISYLTMKKSIMLLIITLLLNFFFKLINSILYAIQLPFLNNFVYLITSLITFLYVLFAKSNPNIEVNLIRFSIVNLIAMNLPLVVISFVVFCTKLKNFKPSIKYIDKNVCKDMMQLSLSFFFAQLSFMLLVSSNEIFISRLYSPDCVVEYNIYYRIFTIFGSLVVLALGPIWSYITKLLVNKDFVKIKKYNLLLHLTVPITLIIQLLIILCLKFVFNLWLNENAPIINYMYAFIFAIYGTVYVYNCVVTTIANSFGKVLSQIIFYSIGVHVYSPL